MEVLEILNYSITLNLNSSHFKLFYFSNVLFEQDNLMNFKLF